MGPVVGREQPLALFLQILRALPRFTTSSSSTMTPPKSHALVWGAFTALASPAATANSYVSSHATTFPLPREHRTYTPTVWRALNFRRPLPTGFHPPRCGVQSPRASLGHHLGTPLGDDQYRPCRPLAPVPMRRRSSQLMRSLPPCRRRPPLGSNVSRRPTGALLSSRELPGGESHQAMRENLPRVSGTTRRTSRDHLGSPSRPDWYCG